MTYKKSSIAFALIALAGTFIFSSCKKKKTDEEELITTVKFSLQQNNITKGTFQWKDLDGDGGNAPQPTDTITLDSGMIYNASVAFLNESNGQNIDITEEIKSESADHLICYTAPVSALEISITDSDGKYPIGLTSDWKTLAKGTYTLRVVLRHQPGEKNGSCDPGETDVDVNFPVRIK
ncbi:MAG: hypothetical protein IT244_07705 [Bacteroidia bacterium]|nr:hypothetical protein [Bacteroidia bacterium]